MILAASETYKELQEYQALLDRIEVTLRNRMTRELNRFYREYGKAYMAGDAVSLPFIVIKHQNNIVTLLQENIKRVVKPSARLAMSQIKRAIKSDERTLWQKIADRWILTQGLNEAKGISETSLKLIRDAILAVTQETVSTYAIGKAIRGVMGMSSTRAALIARTESHGAAMFASLETAKEAEDDFNITLVKAWVPVLDSRTRDSHAYMSQHPAIGLDEKFRVGGTMMERPSDPAGGAGNVINCRCVMVMREKQIEIE